MDEKNKSFLVCLFFDRQRCKLDILSPDFKFEYVRKNIDFKIFFDKECFTILDEYKNSVYDYIKKQHSVPYPSKRNDVIEWCTKKYLKDNWNINEEDLYKRINIWHEWMYLDKLEDIVSNNEIEKDHKTSDLHKLYKYGIYHFEATKEETESYIGFCPVFRNYCINGSTLEEVIQTAEEMINEAVVDDYLHQVKGDCHYNQPLSSTDEEIIKEVKEFLRDELDMEFNEKEFFMQYAKLEDTTMAIISHGREKEEIYINEQISHMAQCWASRLGMSFGEYIETAINEYNKNLIKSNAFVLPNDDED